MATPLKLTAHELLGLRGMGEQLDLLEVEEVYLPLARLIHLQVAARQRLFAATAEFLGEPQQNPDRPVPFIIGVAGSVAVGKSTTARVLQALLARFGHHPRVDLVTTDGFLYPNAELQRRKIMHRKGFPESYDRRALMRFVTAVKSGADQASAPVYSHLIYDIVPGEKVVVRHPDILIIEGLNVLQTGPALMISDLFDFSVYVDARIEDIEQWYVSRFLAMRAGAFANPQSHFHHYSTLTDEQAESGEGAEDTPSIEGSHALVAVGGVPNTAGLGLDDVGVKLADSGHVIVDGVSRTSVPSIYAAGDCTGKLALASVAAMQGRIAVAHLLGDALKPLRPHLLASNIFTSPEIATVGVSQAQVDSGQYQADVLRLDFHTNPRAKMSGAEEGFVKIFARQGSGTVIGGVVVSPRASELIYALALAVTHKLHVDDLADTFTVYPSMSGSIAEAARRLHVRI